MQYPSDYTDDLRRKPICGVMATAIASGVTFARAEQAIKNNMMPFQKRHGGRTYPEQVRAAITECGKQVHELPVERMTLQKWYARYCSPSRTYVIMVTNHYVTIGAGLVADQVEMLPIDLHWARRKFILEVWEIA